MSSPVINKTEEHAPLTITPGAKKIFLALYRGQTNAGAVDDDTPKLQVSDLISKMAFYYEKIRNAVHYSEEHLLRKDAINRILKRQLVIEGSMKMSRNDDARSVAQHLLMELIRASYLPNNTLPETMIDEVAEILDKYLSLRRLWIDEAAGGFNFFGAGTKFENRAELSAWLVGMAAAEIEEKVGRDETSKAIIAVMYDMLEKRVELPTALNAYESDLPIQLYLAIHRRFLKFDPDMLSLILIRYFNGDWQDATPPTIRRIAKNLPALRKLVETQLRHPLGDTLDRLTSTYTVYFTILKDVISEDPVAVYDEFFEDPKAFGRRVKRACNRRYTAARSKLWRSAWRSIIYILLTKSIFAAILEIPAAKFFGEIINPVALGINIGFPAVLLLFAVAATRLPKDDNTARIIAGIEEIVFAEKRRKEPIRVRKPIGRHPVMNVIFGLFYIVTFFISFGAVVWLLDTIQFSWVSTVIFLFFLAFVSFFIIRIRRGAKEWVVIQPRETISRFLLDFFSTPIVATGKWLSTRFSRINVFVFILDFIIEAPFKVVVEVAEEWTKYVRERKDEI